MSNKNLLNESTIRKFMKLASIEPLASDFISKIQEAEEDVEEGMHPPKKKDDDEMREGADEDLEEGYDMKKDEDLDEEVDLDLDEEVDLDEMGMAYQDDEDMADMGADAGRMLDMDQFLQVLEKAVEEFLGEPTEVEYDAEAEMDMEEPEGEMEMDMEMDAEEPMDMADAGEEEEEEEEDLAEAIYKQVLKRLSK